MDQFKKIAFKPNFCNIKCDYLLQMTHILSSNLVLESLQVYKFS